MSEWKINKNNITTEKTTETQKLQEKMLSKKYHSLATVRFTLCLCLGMRKRASVSVSLEQKYLDRALTHTHTRHCRWLCKRKENKKGTGERPTHVETQWCTVWDD